MDVTETSVGEADPDRANRADRAARILAEAFLDDPVAAWMFPDREGRAALLPGFMRTFVDRALATDRVLIAGGDLGIAAWVRVPEPDSRSAPDADEPELPPAYLPYVERLGTIGALLDARHPSAGGHLWLPAIGVRPEARGSGVGSALLEYRLGQELLQSRAEGARWAEGANHAGGVGDAEDAGPAYLEASSERNKKLYERFGFRAYGDVIQLPDGPPIFPMWRDGAGDAAPTSNATTKGTT